MTGPRFSDVTDACDNAADVAWCAEKGLMAGVTASTFEPERAATQAEAVTVLYRLSGSPDVASTGANWYDRAVAWAAQTGIAHITGPKTPITRVQWAVMVGNWLDTQKLVPGTGDQTDLSGKPGWSQVPAQAQADFSFALSNGLLPMGADGVDAGGPVTRCQIADACAGIRAVLVQPAA